LRELRDEDLPLLFEQWADPVAAHMAAFTAPDHRIRAPVVEATSRRDGARQGHRRRRRHRRDDRVLGRRRRARGDVLDRSLLLGQRIATDALKAFLAVDRSRPLYARVASDNVASLRVLEKCGFHVIATKETSLKRAQPRSRNSCCCSTRSPPRNKASAVEGEAAAGLAFEPIPLFARPHKAVGSRDWRCQVLPFC
jgi:hypothetical protein